MTVQVDCNFVITAPDGSRALIGPNKADPDWIGYLVDPQQASSGDSGGSNLATSQVLTGLDSPDVRVAVTLKAQADGSVQSANWYGGRPITMQGVIIPDTGLIQDINKRVNKLQRATNAMRADATLTWQETGGVPQMVYVRRNAPLRIVGQVVKSFFIGFYSPRPEILSASENSQTIVTPDILDDFSVNSSADYTFYSGTSSQLTWTGTNLQVNSVSPAVGFYRSLEGQQFGDNSVTVKMTTGASVASFDFSLLAHLLDSSNMLALEASNGGLTLRKKDAGTWSTLTTTAAFSPALTTATDYWLRLTCLGNSVTGELWTQAPSMTGTAQQSVSTTLTSTNATKFGAGILGYSGLEFDVMPSDWRFDDLSLHSLSGAQTSGLHFPMTFPLFFSQSGSMAASSVANAGTFPTWPRITLYGPIQNPSLINNTAGLEMDFTTQLAAGDWMVVDFDNKTISINGVNAYSALTGGTWWQLLPGSNDVRVNATSYSAPASATCYWRDAWI